MPPRNPVRKKSLLSNDSPVQPVKEIPAPPASGKEDKKLPGGKPSAVSRAKEKLSRLSFTKGDVPTLC